MMNFFLKFRALFFASLILASSSRAQARVAAGVFEYKNRGIYFLDTVVECPLAGVGSRPAKSCLRLALMDDASSVTVDQSAKRIVIFNNRDYATSEQIIDLAIPVQLNSKSIGSFAGIIHLKVGKKHHEFSPNLQANIALIRDAVDAPVFDPYEVSLQDGKTTATALTAKIATTVIAKKLQSQNFVQFEAWKIKDSKGDVAVAKGEKNWLDSSVAVGFKKLNKKLIRVSLKNTSDVPVKSVVDFLKSRSWQIAITSLSSLLPQSDISDDLFLYHLDPYSELKTIMSGVKKGQTLVLKHSEGKTALMFDGKSIDISNASEALRELMEFNSLGIALRGELQRQVVTYGR